MKRKPNHETAEKLYQKFHGKKAEKSTIIEVNEADYSNHPELAKLGDLVSLTCGEGVELTGKYLHQPKALYEDAWASTIEFTEHAPDVAATPEPDAQIYFVRGDQQITLAQFPNIDTSKELIELGPCIRIEYLTQKGFDNFRPTRYYHCFGEESGEYQGDESVCPTLLYNRVRRKLYLIGGIYSIKKDGIID